MDRQRSSSSSSTSCYCLLSPKGLILLSFASSSLLFSFLFSLFALRFGRPLHLPFVASSSLGGNAAASAIARAPVLAAGGGGSTSGAAVEVEEVAVLAGGSGNGSFGEAEAARRSDAGGFPSGRGVGSAMEAKLGSEKGQAPANGEGSDKAMALEGADAGGGDVNKPAKDAVLEKPNSAAVEKTARGAAGSAMATPFLVSNASASQGAATPGEEPKKLKSVQHVNSTMEASGPAVGGSGNSSEEEAYTSQQVQQLEAHSTVLNSSGAAPSSPSRQNTDPVQETVGSKVDVVRSNATLLCNVYDGRWVFDESYPLYTSDLCPFIDEGFSCEANGRMDRSYMKWRWQPTHCSIPRFDARKMLEMLQGKRLVFIGDSINRNQWESMMCLLRGAVSDPARIHEARGRRITKERGDYNFKFLDYNCSVEYHVTHFLVHEGKARIGQKRTRTLRIDTIDRTSSKWRGADFLVFNTAHWWSHHKTKAGVNYYQEGDHVYPHLDASTAFLKALATWGSWVDHYINPRKTRVFFRSSSPSHFSGGEWNSGGHCRESTLPLNDTRVRPVPEMNMMLEHVTRQMKTHVTILNITNLSGLRIDGHPSVYGRKGVVGLAASSIQDCSHWCLPGVPDAWNELLFYHLVSSQENGVTG
ncbi:protein trichome birefringence-like 6 [Oryza brachyantha]|uniref:protein trichome birefringence-like 6 n=1 Tax=Oryza brachyantha TaxID=4533 RepID=UPI0003EAD98B|nr:protein trichome birefringence-like 6 [Oryza brachyantha]